MILALFFVASLQINPDLNNIKALDVLVESTENNLQALKSLREAINTFEAKQIVLVENPNDTLLLNQVISLANSIQMTISEGQIEPYFHEDFLKEVRFFAKFSKQKQLPLP